ncbi:MAG TPA: acyl-homoserine-lactone synthase [Paracoccaceae bacterium]|nr:acyl-homoserine-lactone synthase [Paracoccaceae bacterium]
MLRYLSGSELSRYSALESTMFRDRAAQFRDRLGWEVSVDSNGWERDQYDDLDPLYVIWQLADGTHGGSMRFLPTIGRTMINEHFLGLLDGVPLQDPHTWECTRFCLSPNASGQVAAALMLGGGEVMRHFGVRHLVGVFDARMVRVYRQIGASPKLLGTDKNGPSPISAGLWTYDPLDRLRILHRVGISVAISERWVARSLGIQALPLSA